MNIPDSIEMLTTTGTGDSFNVPQPIPTLNSNAIIDIIKQNLNTTGSKAFNQGSAFYKISNDEKQFLKNIINLYNDILIKAIQEFQTDDKQKNNLIEFQKSFFKNFEQQIETFFIVFNSIIDKKIIDVNEISCSILGYAIETIRRNS